MITNHYDAIVVGARCAGSPTAMLLARQGHRVLLVDRATFPSDTVSTHLVHAPGVAALARWGVLDEVLASGCPPIERYAFDFGFFTLAGSPGTAYAPRRQILDTVLVDAARDAGADVREGFTVEDVMTEQERVVGIRGRDAAGDAVEARASVVIGADGWHSRVADAVGATPYREVPALQFAAYSYWRGLPLEGFETYVRPDRGWAAIPTNDGLTLVVVGWPIVEAAAYKADIEGNFHATLELVPEFAERVRRATRVERFHTGSVPNLFRPSSGPGWVLVGDAGYVRDPITAQGITDAFVDAERTAAALDAALWGRACFEGVMAERQQARDAAVTPMFELTTQLATLAPPPPEVAELLATVSTSPPAMDAFMAMVAGIVSPATFFDPSFLGPLLQPAA